MFTCASGKCFSNHEPISCTHTGGSRSGDDVLVELPDMSVSPKWHGERTRSEVRRVQYAPVSPGEQKRLEYNEVRRVWYEYHWRQQRQHLAYEMVRYLTAPPYYHRDAVVGGLTRLIHCGSGLPRDLQYLPKPRGW